MMVASIEESPLGESLDPASRFRLDDRIAVVTGASFALGRRFAEVLSAAGATVVVTGRRPDVVDAVVTRLPRTEGVVLNIREPEGRARLVEHLETRHGRIDVLVNTASMVATRPRGESCDGDTPVIDLHLDAAYDLARRVARGMIERRSGAIVNVAYISGPVTFRDALTDVYAPAKDGLLALTSELAAQWGQYGVRVNCLSPGRTEAAIDASVDDGGVSEAWLDRRTPMRRPARLDELDGALLFLASDASSYVTGHDLVVDGGWNCV